MTAQEKYDRIKAIMRDATASDEKSLRGLESFLEKNPSRNLTPYHKFMANNDVFIPDNDTVKMYREQLRSLLDFKDSRVNTIDMGRLPEIYTAFGIADKQLKTNSTTILKALGVKGRNKHNVPKETIENLMPLIYDPEAVFKSLSTSDNPNAYIAVLNAKAENQEQIIAILSPSNDGQGFTFIPSVYEKHNFERLLEKVNDEQKILYIKNKGSETWGQLQSLPRHNSEPSNKNILTKDDFVKGIQKKNNKEKNMSLEYDFDDPTRGLAGDWALEDALEKQMQTEEYRERERAFHAERNREDQFRETATLAEWEEYHRKKNGLPITSENPPLERLEINNKEQSMENERTEAARLASMSDEELKQESREAESARDREARLDGTNEREEAVGQTTGFDQKKASMEAAAYQRTVISGAIKKGELACLPGADGYADTTPAVKLTSGQNFHGTDLLYLKNHTKENAFPTAEYVSYAEIKDAQQDKKDLIIREGQKGVSIHSESFNKETNEWEKTHTRWFNVAQLNKPAVMKEWAAEKQMEKYQEYVAYKKTQHGDNWKPDPPKQKQVGHDVVCSSTEPKEYLGQYLAAVSMGSKFSATPEQAAEFSQKMQDTMWAKTLTSPKTGEPVTNPFALAKISNEANKYCKEFIQQAKIEARKQEQPEQKLAQSRGRGM